MTPKGDKVRCGDNPIIPETSEKGQEDCFKLEVSLDCRVNSRPAGAIY